MLQSAFRPRSRPIGVLRLDASYSPMKRVAYSVEALGASADEALRRESSDSIRDLAGLTGTKFGCGVGLCGSCTVHVDGVAVRSCMTTLGEVAGKEITTPLPMRHMTPSRRMPDGIRWRIVFSPSMTSV